MSTRGPGRPARSTTGRSIIWPLCTVTELSVAVGPAEPGPGREPARQLRVDGPQSQAGELVRVPFTEDQWQALLVLTPPPRTEGCEKLQPLAVLGHEHFAGAGRS